MKKILSNFKRIFTDNKQYFVKCTIMSVIVAFILGLTITLTVPSSAAGDPIESDQVTIPAGSYRFNDDLDTASHETISQAINFTASFTDRYFGGDGSTIISGVCSNIFYSNIQGDLGYTFVSSDPDLVQIGISYPVELWMHGGGGWSDDLCKYITVLEDTSANITFAEWFFRNTSSVTGYVIEAGHYLAKESMNGRYFNASNDSIDLRYYDPFSSSYVDAEGMIFTIENRDIYMIYYGSDEVFLDGWQMDAYRSIEVLNDISVDPQFYDCFFGLYSPSDADSNSYNVGFADGYIEGRDDGYSEGYNQGYHQGLSDSIGSSDTFLGGVVENVLDALDKLVIVGDVSILDILKTVIGAFVVIFFLKLIAGG